MPQLGRFDETYHDPATGKPRRSASVSIYREGATVNGNQAGTTPLIVTVRHRGKIAIGDAVFVDTTTGTTFTVDAANFTATTLQLSGFAGTLTLTNGQRLTPSGTQPTLYGDDQGGATTSNPLTTSVTGRANCWMEYGAYDTIVTGGGLTATAFISQVAATEAPGQTRYADDFQYGSSTGGIQEALNDLPSTGGVVIGPGSARTISASITMSTAGSVLQLQPVTLTFNASRQLIVSANDVTVQGYGDASLLDFSAETGAVNSISATTDRLRFQSFKMACGRTNGSTGNGIVLNGTDTAFVRDVTQTNAGGHGIYTATATDIHILDSRITSSRNSGIFCDSSLTGLWVRDNTLTTCVVDDTAGNSSVAIRGNISGAAFDSDIHITHNRIKDTKRVGITVNGGSDPVGFPTRRVFITDNNIDTTGLGASAAGEGIACTINDAYIARNRVHKAANVGILLYTVCKKIAVTDNIVSDSSTDVSASHPAIQLHLGVSGTGAISDIVVSGNLAYDDQGAPTQNSLFQLNRGSGGTFARIYFFGNVSDGTWNSSPLTNQNDTISYSNLADRAAVVNFHHTSDYFTQNITAAATALTAYVPTLYLTADNNYTLTAVPTIADGYEGQKLRIINVDTVDTITLQDQGTLGGSNLRLSAATIALAPRDNIMLQFSSTIGDWVQMGQVNVL